MTAKVQQLLNDKAWARWTALVLIASMMFFAYMFVDVMSPLMSLVERQYDWNPDTFGTYAASEYILNVCGFLIIAGVILDKMGIRFTGITSATVMVIGASIKFIGLSEWFQDTSFAAWLNSWWVEMPASAKMAALGFMIFGCGCEMAGTTVSKAIAKWFKGKEMALAMGLEMAIARLGVFAVMWISPLLAGDSVTTPDGTTTFAANASVTPPVAFCTVLLLIGLINYIIFSCMDTKFDKQLAAKGEAAGEEPSDEEFHMSDLKLVFKNKMFWIVAMLCVLYYSAIFPFQRYAANYLEVTLGVSAQTGARLFSFFPILAMCLTPFLGAFLDRVGKGATMLYIGALIMVGCHLSFAFLLPLFPNEVFAVVLIAILGLSFSLVPAALWPSVPKIIDEKVLGSAYCLIFWIQNIGLCFVPLLIGVLLRSTGGYTLPMVVFSSFGVLAFLFTILLKAEDRKHKYGLEKPNIQRTDVLEAEAQDAEQ